MEGLLSTGPTQFSYRIIGTYLFNQIKHSTAQYETHDKFVLESSIKVIYLPTNFASLKWAWNTMFDICTKLSVIDYLLIFM